MPIIDKKARFWRWCDVPSDRHDCWWWRYRTNSAGYGVYVWDGQAALAHHVAYYLTYGTHQSAYIRQTCGNHACCNPAHLSARPEPLAGYSPQGYYSYPPNV